MSREPSNYTVTNGVRQKWNDNPLPKGIIGECIEKGEIVSHDTKNSMKVTLRYEQGADHIELMIDLENNKVFSLRSSYERDWKRASD